jgi:RNA polymerase sigma-70 factor, ECF subfamily
VYLRLHRLAERALRGERQEHTLRATALVHEAYLRLAAHALPDWQDRGHFFALVARMMRRILVDHARAQRAARRGDGRLRVVELDEIAEEVADAGADVLELIELDRALDALAQYDARKAQVVEFRCFLGFSVEETAALLAVSEPTVILDLRLARAWLSAHLGTDDD